jgi:peptidoglycan/LPS O-acetylase OafA/YrhL
MQTLKYRADIDGLRGLAILAVVTFHAFPKLLQGGFVGVDIFFVISGFLISNIIFDNLDSGSFSFKDFYSRRIKRIFPALIAVLLFCLIFGWFLLLPDEFMALGKHVTAGSGFLSNFILWREVGYFDGASETKPLLHLWSLSIEEQFYILWPFFIWLIWKKRSRVLSAITIVALMSFLFCLIQVHNAPAQAFYSPVARFWEILIGSLLAYLLKYKPSLVAHKSLQQANLKSLVGFILVCVGAVFLNKQSVFPGGWALLPTFGTFLMISAGPEAWFNRIVLSNRILVAVGLMSYPLYLWHWPLLTFTRILNFNPPSYAVITLIVVMSFLLAWLTNILIEKKIRFLRHWVLPPAMAMSLASVAGFGFFVFQKEGLISPAQKEMPDILRANLDQISWEKYFHDISEKYPPCEPQKIRNLQLMFNKDIVRCRQTVKNNSKHSIALIGDSHAEHLFAGIAQEISPHENLVYFTGSCMPFLGLTGEGCQNMNETLEHIIAEPSVHTVIIAGYWGYDLRLPIFRWMVDSKNLDRFGFFKESLEKTMRALVSAGKNVIFAYDTPPLSFNAKKCIRVLIKPDTIHGDCVVTRDYVEQFQKDYRKIADEVLTQFPEIKKWDPIKLLCGQDVCPILKAGHLMYLDDSHITTFTSLMIGKQFVDQFHFNSASVYSKGPLREADRR